MATELGKAYVQIIPSAKGIGSSISSELSGEMGSAGTNIGQSLVGSIKKIIAVAAIGKFIGDSLKQGGELQQSLGGIETLFKDNADKVKAYAKEAYRTTGLSANEYMKSVTGFSASLLQSLGGDTAKAADISNMAMTDMADNSNKMGTSMELIQNAYQGFAKQNYTMLDNLKLGYGGTKSEMERLLADAQKITGVKYDINSLSDVYEAIHVIQKELDITGTTAKEASSTLEGSFNSMKASWQDILGNLATGGDIQGSVTALANTSATFLFKNLLPMVFNIVKALPSAVITFLKTAIPIIITEGSNLINEMVSNAPQMLDIGIKVISNIVNGILTAIPKITTVAGNIGVNFINSFTTVFPMVLKKGRELILKIIDGITTKGPDAIKSMVDLLVRLITTITEKLPEYVKKGVEIIISLAKGIIQRLPDIILAIGKITFVILDALFKLLPKILIAGIDIIKTLAKGILKMLELALSAIGQIISGIIRVIANAMGSILRKGVEIVSNIASGISRSVGNVVGAVGNVIREGMNAVTRWMNSFYNAGGNIVKTIADGIWDAISWVTDAIGDVAQAIRDYLPFSPAKEGPLRDLNRLNFGGTIADSIDYGRKEVFDSINSLTDGINDKLKINPLVDIGDIKSSSIDINLLKDLYFSGINSEFKNDNTEMVELIKMVDTLLSILSEKKNTQVVLDSGTLVGELIDMIDDKLGILQIRKLRGE